jgi:hypothetical protein
MNRKTQTKTKIFNKDVYLVYLLQDKWAVIIMPENIVIDNHHVEYSHVHPNPKEHSLKEEISLENPEEVYEKVMAHIEENEGLKLEKLIEELKK